MNEQSVQPSVEEYDPTKPTKYKWKFENDSLIVLDEKNSTNLASDDDYKFFKFKVRREIAFDKKEDLHINAVYQKNDDKPIEHGKIVTNLPNIQEDICQFRLYGVVLTRKDFIDIAKIIEQFYLRIDSHENSNPAFNYSNSSNDVAKVFKYICQYIYDTGIPSLEIGNKFLYNIPIDEFKDFVLNIDDCQNLDYAKIKKALLEQGYTKCNTGRTDNTICIALDKEPESKTKANEPEANKKRAVKSSALGKRIKVMSFYKDKVDAVNEK